MIRNAKFHIGQVVRHRIFPFRGLIYDVDPVFDNTDEWYESIPKLMRPAKDQPYYHLYAQNDETVYEAYVSEQNLLFDDSGVSLRHPNIAHEFIQDAGGKWQLRNLATH